MTFAFLLPSRLVAPLGRKPSPRRRPHVVRIEALEPRALPAGFLPSAWEQVYLERLNDARADPPAYGRSIGLDELNGIPPAQPLAFDPLLIQAARLHAQNMNDHNYIGHINPEGLTPEQRAARTGYRYGHPVSEVNEAGRWHPADSLAALIEDFGIPDLGHRRHLRRSARLAAALGAARATSCPEHEQPINDRAVPAPPRGRRLNDESNGPRNEVGGPPPTE